MLLYAVVYGGMSILYFSDILGFFFLMLVGKPQRYLRFREGNISLSDPAATFQ